MDSLLEKLESHSWVEPDSRLTSSKRRPLQVHWVRLSSFAQALSKYRRTLSMCHCQVFSRLISRIKAVPPGGSEGGGCEGGGGNVISNVQAYIMLSGLDVLCTITRLEFWLRLSCAIERAAVRYLSSAEVHSAQCGATSR